MRGAYLPDDDLVNRVESIERILKEVLNWLKVGSIPQLRLTLTQELDSEVKKRVYELTDGMKSQNEIEAATKVSRRMVSYYWQKWYGMGIVVDSEKRKGRMQKIVSLDQVGISYSPHPEKQSRLTDMEFEPQDLRSVLSSEKVFPQTSDLLNFALNILQISESNMTGSVTREDLIEKIIREFELSDRMKQSLFIQALERRVLEKESTEFRRFFEAWERQIGR
jgi:biotin operon repressor